MAEPDLITQVQKKDDANLQKNPRYDQDIPPSYSAPGLLTIISDLCCCCFGTGSSRSTELYNANPLTTAEMYRREAYGTSNPQFDQPLLPPQPDFCRGKQTLVLDLDETLVHSSFKPIPNPDFIVPVEIDDHVHKVYVAKRPGVDKFLAAMGPIFEVVVFTASLAKYADPVLDLLDPNKHVIWRLFREHCTNFKGNFVKDLGRLGRDLKKITIIDNSHTSYLFHPEHSIACESWFDDESDQELYELIPVLQKLSTKSDVLPDLEEYRRKQGKRISNFY